MFSELSLNLTEKFTKDTIKKYGIYFTPKPIIDQCIHEVYKCIEEPVTNILEPSCGSCEFIPEIRSRFPSSTIDGIELNEVIYSNIIHLQTSNITLHCCDFLHWTTSKKYSVIIGNPPYFVIKKTDVPSIYHRYFTGRPNIYVIFILKSLELLEDNGILSFVIPINFLTCIYYLNTRQYIAESFYIRSIVMCTPGDFLDTQQETIILTIQRRNVLSKDELMERNDKFILRFYGNVAISFNTVENVITLKNLIHGSRSLSSMGITASIGTVVWNQCKDILTDDSSFTRLIYNSNIKGGGLIEVSFKDAKKKSYIQKDGERGPIMVLNRGYGTGNYVFNHCIIDIPEPYLIENHLICIRCPANTLNTLETYRLIEQSLNNPKTTEFVSLYFGNNAINCSELMWVLPIYM